MHAYEEHSFHHPTTKLNPIPVAGHLLLSMLLIAGAATLQFKVNDYREIEDSSIGRAMAALAFLTLMAGTVVTGSGPHAGDWQAPRFHFNLYMVAHIHSVFVAITFAIALYIAIKLPRREANFLIGVMIFQGLIGAIQWRLGLPQYLVGLHLLGSALFWFAVWRTRLSFKFSRHGNQPVLKGM